MHSSSSEKADKPQYRKSRKAAVSFTLITENEEAVEASPTERFLCEISRNFYTTLIYSFFFLAFSFFNLFYETYIPFSKYKVLTSCNMLITESFMVLTFRQIHLYILVDKPSYNYSIERCVHHHLNCLLFTELLKL